MARAEPPTLLFPASHRVVRVSLAAGRRLTFGTLRALEAGALHIAGAPPPASTECVARVLGPPGLEPVELVGLARPVPGGGARFETATWNADLARALQRILGVPDDPPLLLPPDEPELPSNPPSPAPALGRAPTPTPAPGLAAHPSGAGGQRQPAKATTDALLGAPRTGARDPLQLDMAVLHLSGRALVAHLARQPGELAPMFEVSGLEGVKPRQVLAACISLSEGHLWCEATVVTTRGTSARVRLALPSDAARGLLEATA